MNYYKKKSKNSMNMKHSRKDEENAPVSKPKKSAMEVACTYLATRMRTIAEIEKHLASKDYDEPEIRECINDLIGMRYVDDYQYALRYFEYNREKHRATDRGVRELLAKGVDSETISNAREDFMFENKLDEFQDALDIALRELSLRNRSEYGDEEYESISKLSEKLAGSIGRKLQNKGFRPEIIYRVLERIRSAGEIELS